MKNKRLIIINFLIMFLLKNNFNFIIIYKLLKDLKSQIFIHNDYNNKKFIVSQAPDKNLIFESEKFNYLPNDYNNKKFIISQAPDKNLIFESEKFNYLPNEGINNLKYNNFFIYNKKFYNNNNYIFYSYYTIMNADEYEDYANKNKYYCLIEGLSINADLRGQKLGQLSFALLLKEIFKNNEIIFIKLCDFTLKGDFYSKFLFKENENYKVLTREVYEKNKEYFDKLLNSLLLEKNITIEYKY